jgi:mannose/fructose-specific phosphotransferase system component IIA
MKILLVSNGSLASAMLESMKNYFSQPELTAICFEQQHWDKARQEVALELKAVVRQNRQEPILVLCDTFGSTAFIETAILLEKMGLRKQSLILCGMNLPMVFKLYGLRDTATLQLCRSLYEEDSRHGTYLYAYA